MTLPDLCVAIFGLGLGASGLGVWTGRFRGWERSGYARPRALAVPYFALAVLWGAAGYAWVRLGGPTPPLWLVGLPAAAVFLVGFWMYLTEGAWTPALLPPWYRRYLASPETYPPAPGPEVGRLELSPTRRFLVVLAVGVALLPAGAWLVEQRDVMGFVVLAVGAGLIAWVALRSIRRDRLALTAAGLTVRRGDRDAVVPWSVVERVEAQEPGWFRSGTVRLVLRPDAAFNPADAGLGPDGALPSLYGLHHADLASVLDRWRSGAVRPPLGERLGS